MVRLQSRLVIVAVSALTILLFFVGLSFLFQSDTSLADTFPRKRLNEWEAFLNRAPLKIGKMHWDFTPEQNKSWTFITTRHGRLSVSSLDGVIKETVINGDYAATVRLREGYNPRMESIREDDRPRLIENGFYHTSGVPRDFVIPELIRNSIIELSSVETANGVTQYGFNFNRSKYNGNFRQIILKFDDRYAIPIFSELIRELPDGRTASQRLQYFDFIEVNGEFVPSVFKSRVIFNEDEYDTKETTVRIEYDPSIQPGPERFQLSYYGIPEPEMAKNEPESRFYYWLAGGLLVVVILILLVNHRRKLR